MLTRILWRMHVQITIALLAVVLVIPLSSHAATYTNENFLFSYHYKPVSFSLTANGGFIGTLENGAEFQQVPILTEPSVRLHKFTIDNASFYISDRGTIQASSNLVALSIYSYLSTT